MHQSNTAAHENIPKKPSPQTPPFTISMNTTSKCQQTSAKNSNPNFPKLSNQHNLQHQIKTWVMKDLPVSESCHHSQFVLGEL